MHSPRYLVDQLRFPAPPARVDRSWKEAPFTRPIATEYLAEIRRWRARLLEVLAGNGSVIDGLPSFSDRARDHLILLLAGEWDAGTTRWARDSSYNIAPFPAVPPSGPVDDPMGMVMDVLRWRAAVADYLSDVWDVLGKPSLEFVECSAMRDLVQPVRMEGRCVFCLSEFGAKLVAPEDHGCVMLSHVRAKGPPAADP
jgi:hypothetical protein